MENGRVCKVGSSAMACEVLIAGEWQTVSAQRAHWNFRDATRRCLSCGDPILTLGTYTFHSPAIRVHHVKKGTRRARTTLSRPDFVASVSLRHHG